MKKVRKTNKIGHFFKHYAGLLFMALFCAVLSVVLIAFVA